MEHGMAFERRRYPRKEICLFVTVSCQDRHLEGYTVNVSSSGLLIHALESLPSEGETCNLAMDPNSERVLSHPSEQICARGRVVRVMEERRQFSVELEHLEQNGDVFLSLLVA
jgi:hypothetical protein